MLGASSTFTFATSQNTDFTFGGYWTGGKGNTIQQVGQQLSIVDKSLQIYTMVVGTAYRF
jgi:hypothetical protein